MNKETLIENIILSMTEREQRDFVHSGVTPSLALSILNSYLEYQLSNGKNFKDATTEIYWMRGMIAHLIIKEHDGE